MFDAIVLWIHILAAAVFVGPQIFLATVAMPAVRSMADTQARVSLTRAITRGFGWLGGAALGVLLVTGIWNWYAADDDGLLDIDRYFTVLQIKLTLVVIVLALTAVHGMVFGRKLMELQEANAPEAEIAQARQRLMIASMTNLALSIAILFFAALLSSDWSKQ